MLTFDSLHIFKRKIKGKYTLENVKVKANKRGEMSPELKFIYSEKATKIWQRRYFIISKKIVYLPLILRLKIWRESKVNIWLPGWRPWTSCVLWSLWKRQTFAKYCGSNARLHWKTQPGKQLFWHWWGLYQHGPGMSKIKNFIKASKTVW